MHIIAHFEVSIDTNLNFVLNNFKLEKMEIKMTLDCKGLSCPMPMMKIAKAMKELKSGEVLEVLGTDPGTKTDLPSWCEKSGNELVESSDLDGGVNRFVLRKG